MKSLAKLAILVPVLMVVSCSQAAMKDSSSDPEYSSTIGQQFKTREEVWAIGVTADKNYKRQVDYVMLVLGVGFSGPEVVSRERVEKGSIFRVVRVLTAESSFSPRVLYIVEEVGLRRFGEFEIRVNVVGSPKDSSLGLDSSVYESVGSGELGP